MQIEDLKILLSLEPVWTVAINGQDYLELNARDIEVGERSIRFGRLTRRILGIRWLRSNVVRVDVSSRVHAKRDVLVFYPRGFASLGFEIRKRRRAFQRRMMPALEHFFRSPVNKRILHSDKTHGIGGAYPRFVLAGKAIITVDPDESSAVVNGVMRAAIQWSALLQRKVAVVVPAGRKDTVVTRLQAMPRLLKSFDWLEWDGDTISPLELQDAPPETHVHPFFEPNVRTEVERICSLAPGLLQAVPNIPARAVSIRLRGLEIARLAEDGTTYPMGEPLEPLIERLSRQRAHGSKHPLARMHEEGWLESSLITHITDVLPVRRGAVYPQVPSFSGVDGQDRRVIDLLAMTVTGRLAVIEIKATADPELPFQALDYWMAVERHRKAGDFQAQGYFAGATLSEEPALLVMVAPLLAFHRTLDRLTAFFPKTLPILQIGLNQTWKKEIKILRRRGSLG